MATATQQQQMMNMSAMASQQQNMQSVSNSAQNQVRCLKPFNTCD